MASNTQLCDAAIGRLEKKIQEMKTVLRKENNYLYKINVKKMESIIKMLDTKKKKKSKDNMTIVIVVAAVALGVAGYLSYKYFKGRGGLKSALGSASASAASASR